MALRITLSRVDRIEQALDRLATGERRLHASIAEMTRGDYRASDQALVGMLREAMDELSRAGEQMREAQRSVESVRETLIRRAGV